MNAAKLVFPQEMVGFVSSMLGRVKILKSANEKSEFVFKKYSLRFFSKISL